MRIVFLCNEYPPHPRVGGIGVFTHTLAHGLVDTGHEVTVLGYGEDHCERDDRGVRVVILPQSRMRGVAWFISRRRLHSWLKRKARAGRIDILETPEYQGMLPFRFRACAVVVRLHSSGVTKKRLHRILERRTLRAHRNWLAVSRYIAQETQAKYGTSPSRLSVVYNPVNGRAPIAKVTSDLPGNYVLYAGTVREGKGAFILAEAARSFLARHPDLHLLYVGGLTVENGRRADDTIRHILGADLASRVHFTGLVEHDVVLACMKQAKVFAFPSKLESFGLAPAEAMSCGVPVIYSNLHAGPEVVDDSVTGLLADPNSPDDVAEKVLQILNDPVFAARLAKNARRAVEDRFSLQRCLDDTVSFYTTVLQEQRNGCTGR